MSETTERKEPVLLKNVILSYPKLTVAKAVKKGDKERYGAEIRIPKSGVEGFEELQSRVDGIKAEKEKGGKIRIFNSDICLKDGDSPAWEKRKPEHAGYWVLAANRQKEQGPVPAYGKKASAGPLTIEETDKLFYPGCLVNVKVGVYFTDKGGNKSIPCSLELVQFAGDGERLGGGSQASADDLPDIDDDEDDDLPAGM